MLNVLTAAKKDFVTSKSIERRILQGVVAEGYNDDGNNRYFLLQTDKAFKNIQAFKIEYHGDCLI